MLLGGPPKVRRFGAVNLRGAHALFAREMRREFKILTLTLGAPMVRALLMAGVFALALGGTSGGAGGETMGGMPFLDFLIPGLIAVSMLERGFESASFSIVYDKTEGIFTDLAMVPLTAAEIVAGYAGAAVAGALTAALAVWVAMLPFGAPLPAEPLALLFFLVAGGLSVGLFGMMAGLWARKWDGISAVETFLILPFLFLSGVFFSLADLPEAIRPLAQANPVFYIVDGIRFGLTGRAETDMAVAAGVCATMVAVLGAIVLRLFAIGWRLRS